MANSMNITHTMLVVSDLERSLKFYQRAFGFEIVKKRGVAEARGRGASSAMAFVADKDGCAIELKQPFSVSFETGAGIGHICVLCDDLESALEGLRGLGYEPYNVREQLGMSIALVNDPDGHVVELIDRASYRRWWDDPNAGL